MNGEKFWIVWCPTSVRPPSVPHGDPASARREARRLALQHKGAEFYVCEVISVSRAVSVETVDLVEPTPIPF